MIRPIHPALSKKLAALETRKNELEEQALDPKVSSDPHRSRKLFQELGNVRKLVSSKHRLDALAKQTREHEELLADGDEELAALASEELPELAREYEETLTDIETRLLVGDEHGERNAILEIRAGTGGDEAALFARDLARMYERFCERQSWKMQAMHLQESEHGGFKEAIFEVVGDGVFRLLRFEMGGHRVQRVPVTESQGRVHTSAATVAVLPEAEEVDLDIDEKDLEIQATTSSGPGGQHVNKTQSAVRITHVPTGLVVFCQEERSQHKNKARAMQLLRARLYDLEQSKLAAERAQTRKTQVGSGDRSQRIRTYNWPQNRVTDHRIGENFSLEKVVEGDLMPMFDALLRKERDDRLGEL
ncbi:MAG: peptide chain release factor 1 [Planctomycetes bacterium]|nr:peptide chain release factor 1 [Planctomycetota bacterium]MCB9892080.1 peptide chain release factor 1 [Planctomycetota bacterium]MCB9920348.1 peptide chain release factor 1 [Planctomycetota bacterium]